MGAEDHGVTCSQHTDGVADNSLSGVGGGGNGTDDAEGRILHQGQAVVAGQSLSGQILDTGSLGSSQNILGDLIFVAAHASLFHGSAGHVFQIFLLQSHIADNLNVLGTISHRAAHVLALSSLGSVDCLVHGSEDAPVTGGSQFLVGVNLFHDLLHQLFNQIQINIHPEIPPVYFPLTRRVRSGRWSYLPLRCRRRCRWHLPHVPRTCKGSRRQTAQCVRRCLFQCRTGAGRAERPHPIRQ